MSDNNYSLKNMDFFNKHLNADTNKIIQLYSELIIQYFKFITENKNITPKNKNLLSFIITRGLETITYVFSFLLYYTKNVDVAYFHSQKSFYFYVEFIDQISEDENMFLQLSSRDASLYVYKKTIFELNSNSDTKNNLNNLNILSTENEINNKLNEINFYINLYKTFFYKIIQNNDFNNKHIETLHNIYNRLNNCKIKKSIFLVFDTLIDKLFYKISNVNYFFEISLKLINKILTEKSSSIKMTTENILNAYTDKIMSEEFNLYLDENYDKFLIWFFN
jgi:hypothetical protein